MKRISLLLLGAAFLLVSVVPAEAARPQNAQIQTAIAPASMYMRVLERFKSYVETLSGGQLTIELLPIGAVVGGGQIGEAVGNGVVQGGMWWIHWASGRHPAGILFSALPGGGGIGLSEGSQLSWIWEGDGRQLANRYYQDFAKLNVVTFPCLPMGPEPFGWFHDRFTSVEEINRLKFRSPPGVPSEIYAAMGMPVVSMPGAEIVPAAQRGVIDAAEWIGPQEDMMMGLHTVWKYYYLQGLHQSNSIGDIFFNKAWFDKLPANQQAIIEIAARATMADQINMNIHLNSAALVELTRDHGVMLVDTPVDYFVTYMTAAKEVLDRYIAQDAFFKEVWESLVAWAQMTVPYTTRAHGLYYQFGRIAMDTGVIKDFQ